MFLQRFVHVHGQAADILGEVGFARALSRAQRSIETAPAERVPKCDLWKLRRPRVEDTRQPERRRLERVALDNVPAGETSEE